MIGHPRARRAGGLISLLAALALAPPAAAQGAARIKTSAVDARAAATLLSRYRAANGLGPVKVDRRLNLAAEQQARAVALSGSLSHGDFNGRMFTLGVEAAAENLSMGPKSIAEAIAQWRSSSGHNANMLGRNYTRIGLARADAGARYWALLLAR
jgi:uncharacterized protein YkwD